MDYQKKLSMVRVLLSSSQVEQKEITIYVFNGSISFAINDHDRSLSREIFCSITKYILSVSTPISIVQHVLEQLKNHSEMSMINRQSK